MKVEERLIIDIAKHFSKTIVKRLVYKLQRFPKEAMLLGDDSGLKNTWDEICVQEQFDRIFHWEIYDDTVSDICHDLINEYPNPIQNALEYDACQYFYEEYNLNESKTHLVVDKIKKNLYDYAADYENRQIRDYMERQYLD